MSFALLYFHYYNGYSWVAIGEPPASNDFFTFSGVYITDRIIGDASVGNAVIHDPDCRLIYRVETLNTGGSMVLAFRREDADNHWSVNISAAGTLTLKETVGAVATTRGTAASTIVSGDRITITAEDEQIDVYVNGTLEITYASAANFKDEIVAQVLSLGTGGVLGNLSAWEYNDNGLYSGIEVGQFQGGTHLWDDPPGIGSHSCSRNGTGHPSNVKYMSTNTMSLNGAAEAALGDGNLAELNCIRMSLTVVPPATPSGARIYCFDGNDVERFCPGLEAYAFERGVGIGYWRLINSGEAGIGGDNFGERLDLQDKTSPGQEHEWYFVLSASPEYVGNVFPYFGTTVYWS